MVSSVICTKKQLQDPNIETAPKLNLGANKNKVSATCVSNSADVLSNISSTNLSTFVVEPEGFITPLTGLSLAFCGVDEGFDAFAAVKNQK